MSRHPVHALLAECAYHGREPSSAELDELQLGADHREAVRRAAADAARMHAAGDRGTAREHAFEHSMDIIDSLPKAQQDPRYAHRDPLADVTDPSELAAQIPRAGS